MEKFSSARHLQLRNRPINLARSRNGDALKLLSHLPRAIYCFKRAEIPTIGRLKRSIRNDRSGFRAYAGQLHFPFATLHFTKRSLKRPDGRRSGINRPEYRLLLRISVPCKSFNIPTLPGLRVSITVTRFVGGSLRAVY